MFAVQVTENAAERKWRRLAKAITDEVCKDKGYKEQLDDDDVKDVLVAALGRFDIVVEKSRLTEINISFDDWMSWKVGDKALDFLKLVMRTLKVECEAFE